MDEYRVCMIALTHHNPVRITTLRKVIADILMLWRKMWSLLGRHQGWTLLLTLLFLAAIFMLLMPQDSMLLAGIQQREGFDKETRTQLKQLARDISLWGDFGRYNLILVSLLWLGGLFAKSRYFQRMAIASLLCAVLAGLLVNVVRASTGRPRPYMLEKQKAENRFYGLQFKRDFHSFPSGHTATAFGAAIPLVIAMPAVGVPVLVCSTTVAWARLYGNQHHPSDIAAAIWVALLFGIPMGLVVLRTRHLKDGDPPGDSTHAEEDEFVSEVTEA
jgi:membrane-associated phospholipid phosphatase